MSARRAMALGAAAAALTGCTAASTDSSPPADTFRDGTYSAEGEYGGLPSHIGVTVTLDDGIVTDVDVATRATDPTSLDLQQRFAAAVPDVAVGRPIADLQVDKLAGSSGTPSASTTHSTRSVTSPPARHPDDRRTHMTARILGTSGLKVSPSASAARA